MQVRYYKSSIIYGLIRQITATKAGDLICGHPMGL